MKKDLTYCQTRHHEIMVELDQMDELKERENRAFTKEEVEKYEALMREDTRLNGIMEGLLTGKKLEEHREKKAKSQILRELFIKCREDKVALAEDMHDREAANSTTITMAASFGRIRLMVLMAPPYTRRKRRMAERLPHTPISRPAAAKVTDTGCHSCIKGMISSSCMVSLVSTLRATAS